MIEKINKFDKIIARKGTSNGKTLDMSNGKRRYNKNRNIDKAGKTTPSANGFPSYVVDYGKLIGALREIQKNELSESKRCYLHVQEQVEKPGWYDNMFFTCHNMIENYMNYRDIVFINRRFVKTRFNKTLIAFCGLNNQGKNVIFAICLLPKEDQEALEYMMNHFDKAFQQ